MSKRLLVIGTVILGLGGGCANRNTANDLALVKEILECARHDKVQGSLKVHLNGELEAGMREGFYFGSPGTVVQADLAFRVKDLQPATTQPAKKTEPITLRVGTGNK